MRIFGNRLVFYFLFFLIFIVFVVGLSFFKNPAEEDEDAAPQSTEVVIEKFQNLAKSSPKDALQKLRKESTNSRTILVNCHQIAHEIGFTTYSTLGDFKRALSYQDSFCNSGYLHGVIEAFFSSNPLTPEVIQKTCSVSIPFTYNDWQCSHGIGHGIMYANDEDPTDAVETCESLKTQDMISACINGVFMEYFNEEGIEKVEKNNLLSICETYPNEVRPDCYLYAPSGILFFNDYDYTKASEICSKVANDFRGYCFQGIGSVAMKNNMDVPQVVDQICSKTKDFLNCMSGASTYAYFHFGTGRPVGLICLLFGDEGRNICSERRKALSKSFGETTGE